MTSSNDDGGTGCGSIPPDVSPLRPPTAYVDALRRRGFDLQHQIGTGASGRVYRAVQRSLRRPVAIKFYDAPYMDSPENQKRFQRESLLLARVEHPAIPYVITDGRVATQDANTPYFVMQYIHGRPLRAILDERPVLAIDEARSVLQHVLSALQQAHECDVVHRDVKPGNIVVTAHGAYLVDFSVGVSLRHDPGLTRTTSLGQGVGTANYAAPEQITGALAVDHRADIYSAGIVLAELLGARLPLRRDELDVELAEVARPLRRIVMSATEREPGQRFQSASQFLGAIYEAIGPSVVELLDETTVLCPTPGCAGGVWSSGGTGQYFWGPKVIRSGDRCCGHCGGQYLRACARCRRPLPDNIANLVSKASKSAPDALEAHCARCGELLFKTPTCSRCGSYYARDDIKSGIIGGCSRPRCARQSVLDDDIPF